MNLLKYIISMPRFNESIFSFKNKMDESQSVILCTSFFLFLVLFFLGGRKKVKGLKYCCTESLPSKGPCVIDRSFFFVIFMPKNTKRLPF